MDFSSDQLSAYASAISAFFAALAAIIMYWQTKITVKKYQQEHSDSINLQRERNQLLLVQNKITINQMLNDFNKMIIEAPSDLRNDIQKQQFNNCDERMLLRVYKTFCVVNIIEVSWLLAKSDSLPKSTARSLLNDMAVLLQRDKDVVRMALSGRGYDRNFLGALWPLIFPDEPLPN